MDIRTIVLTESNILMLVVATGPKELSTTAWMSVEEAETLRKQLDEGIARARNWKF